MAKTARYRMRAPCKGEVSASGFAGCILAVPVSVERKRGGEWKVIAGAATDLAGDFKIKLKDRPGRYRALLPETAVGTEGSEVCQQAVSQRRRNRR